jgi:hypothetical protein
MRPETLIAAVPANVPVNPVQVIDLAPVFPVEIVQVPVDRFVKKQIVEFSKIVESVVESTNLADSLKTARLDWLENPKKLIF